MEEKTILGAEHDDQCESEFIPEAGAWTECRCSERATPQAPGDRMTVLIDRVGEAFADDPVLQTNLCLAAVAMQLIEDPTRTEGAVRDANGNTCGRWWLQAQGEEF